MGLIRADELEQWASSNAARSKVGELMRRLVHASIRPDAIRYVQFLSDESTELRGWDGELDCDSQVPWVPNGPSVWELATGNRDKIRRDFKTRLEKDLRTGWQQEKTTYVAVTLSKLVDLDALESELRDGSPWMDVKVLYSHTLAEWIEQYENVQTWLQDQSVGPRSTVHTLQHEWLIWSGETEPIVSPSLVLAGREDAARNLRASLGTAGGVTKYQADSPDEVIAFIYAAMAAGTDELSRHFLDTSLVVGQPDDADRLRHASPQYVVLRPPALEKAELLARSGHAVICALGNSAGPTGVDRRLQRATLDQFNKGLAEMNLTEGQAEIEARVCGRSPSVWRVWNLRQRGNLSSKTPEWAKAEHRDLVVPAVLLGAWNKEFDGDKEVVARITGHDFTAYVDKIHSFISQDHPLLTRVGDTWVVTAPATAFALIDYLISPGQIEKLSEIVSDVFKEPDPTIDLPPDERPYAAIRVGGMKHSTWLRDGLAETLLRIVVIGERLENTGAIPSGGRQTFVDQLIRRLPGLTEDWRLLASLRGQLPVLAEAAPNPFLESLERLLQGPTEKILPIFDEGDSLFGHAFHPALWWALETLAWDPKYLGRVALILSEFAKIDPGGKLMNRPINSLRNIFLAWHPGTSAELEQRLQALDAILDRRPEVGWTLLLGLMPQSHDHSSLTHKPIWKDFSRSQQKALTRGMVVQAYEQYIDRTITLAGIDPSRWRQLIKFYDEVGATHREAIEERLSILATSDLREDERNEIWNTLRDFVNHHRQFAEAAWALPSDQLERLDEIKDMFASNDPVARFAWLFNDQLPDLPLSSSDFEELDAERDRLRREAVEEIWRDGGISLVMNLVDNVRYPGFVSPHLLEVLASEADVLLAVEKTSQGSPNHRFFARCLSADAYRRFGRQWTEMVISLASRAKWSQATMVNAFLNYPDSLDTYDLICGLGLEVERGYWQAKQWIFPSGDGEPTRTAVEKLMSVGRALDAAELVQRQFDVFGAEEVLTILDQCLKELNEGKTSQRQGAISWLERLFNLLRERRDVDEAQLARREYAFLPLLTRGHSKKRLTLHKVLSTEPRFFVDVICDLYKPASRDRDEEAVPEASQRRAEFAWELLRSWNQPPGLDERGQVSPEELRRWVTEARVLASEADRKVVADQHIGNMLYYLPPDPVDSAWPHAELRRLIEEAASDDIEKGIAMEQFNSRGVVMYGPLEGGDKERAIAERWRIFANTVGIRWPRTRAMLESIAGWWDSLAAQRDQEAEEERLRS